MAGSLRQYFRGKLFFSAVPEPGAVELLEYLSRRYRLCIASNGPYEQQINRLRLGNMYDFSHFFVSSQIGAQKPSAAFLTSVSTNCGAAAFRT